MDGVIHGFIPQQKKEVRVGVGIGDKVEFYTLFYVKDDTVASHARATAVFFRTGSSADSLIDFKKEIET